MRIKSLFEFKFHDYLIVEIPADSEFQYIFEHEDGETVFGIIRVSPLIIKTLVKKINLLPTTPNDEYILNHTKN